MRNIKWNEAFSVSFYKLSEREVEVMDAEMETKIDNLREGEMLAAVRSLAEEVRTGKKGPKFVPKVGHLMSAIIRNRFLQKHPPADLRQKPLEAKLNVLKNAIMRAPDHAARWEIICDGIHGNQIWTQQECELCPKLEQFTFARFPDFKRPVFQIFGALEHKVIRG